MSTPSNYMRHIIFNGLSDEDFGLTMSGNTPLLVPSPKQSEVEIAYASGTIDTSEIDGTLYFNNLQIEYNMLCPIKTKSSYGHIYTTEEMNALCSAKIEEVDEWLYSGPSTLYDYGLLRTLPDAECQTYSVEKSITTEYWVLKFVIAFKAPYNIPVYYPDYISSRTRRGRFITYNGGTSYNYGLDMINMTPVSYETPKISEMNWPHKNGSLNLSHIRNGYTSGKRSLFFNNREINYTFTKTYSIFENNTRKNVNALNQELQEDVEKFCNWLYVHRNGEFMSIDGTITYGGSSAMLMDSGWIDQELIPESGEVSCRLLLSARVSSVNVTKNIFNSVWTLTLEVTFKTYPVFFNGTLYLPEPEDPSPAPVITVPTWKHYGEFSVNQEYDHTFMIQNSGSISSIEQGIYMPYENIEVSNSLPLSTTGNADNAYWMSGTMIMCKFDFSVAEYEHPSKVIPEGKLDFKLFLELGHYVDIIIGARTVTYYVEALSNYSTNVNYIFNFNTEIINSSGSTVSSTSKRHIAATSAFSGVISALLVPVNGTAFTSSELEAASYHLAVPCVAHYVQMLKGTNVISQYGLWGDDNETACESALPATKCVMDFQETDFFSYDGTPIAPYNHTSELPRKFSAPHDLVGDGMVIKLITPLVDDNPNNYILCDSAKPAGGDIQWYQ